MSFGFQTPVSLTSIGQTFKSSPYSASSLYQIVLYDSKFNTSIVPNTNIALNSFKNRIFYTLTVSNFAGNISPGLTNSTGTASQFNNPVGTVADTSGNIFVADKMNHCIRKIVISTGEVSTLAGNGVAGSTNANGSDARFSSPSGLTIDSSGNLYVADTGNNCIRKIVISSATVTRLAGSMAAGFADGTGNAAVFNGPVGIASIISDTMLIVTDTNNNRIRFVDMVGGIVKTMAGSGVVGRSDGINTNATFNSPTGIVVKQNTKEIYVADSGNNIIRYIGYYYDISNPPYSALGFVNTYYRSLNLNNPTSISVNSYNTLYIADTGNKRILEICLRTSTISGIPGSIGDINGNKDVATFNYPHGIAVDSAGIIYVSQNTGAIRRIAVDGTVTTLFASGSMSNCNGVAIDSAGNVYVADTASNRICKITSLGSMSVLASGFNSPRGIAIDTSNNVYLADCSNNRICKITSAGVVSNIAGSGVAGFADGSGNVAKFNFPVGIAIDTAGNLFVGDSANNRIRIVYTTGVVSTLAGSGVAGYLDAMNGKIAQFNNPTGLTVDNAGNIFVVDKNNYCIRKIAPGGIVSTIAGNSVAGYVDGIEGDTKFENINYICIDSFGNLCIAEYQRQVIRKLIFDVSSIGTGSTGYNNNTYTPNELLTNVPVLSSTPPVTQNNSISTDPIINVNTITSSFIDVDVTTLAGNGSNPIGGFADGPGATASFSYPQGVAVDAAGNVYVADSNNHRIRLISPSGVVITLAGSSYGFANNTGTAARFNNPVGVALDAAGHLYVADLGNNCIRKITFPNGLTLNQGQVSTFAGSGAAGSADGPGATASFRYPNGVAVDPAGNVYVADTDNHRIRLVSSSGVVTTLAGNGTAGFANGTGTAARFYNPWNVALDAAGNLYVADTSNYRIRKITFPNGLILNGGVVETLAGSGAQGANNGPGVTASFYRPSGVVVDAAGNVYVGDQFGNRIRKVTPNGMVTTLAGSGAQGSGIGGFADGYGRFSLFWYIYGLAFHASGKLYVADAYNHRIRKISNLYVYGSYSGICVDNAGNKIIANTDGNRITQIASDGTITTIAGTETGTAGYQDGSGNVALFNDPYGARLDSTNNILVTDKNNNCIRKINTTTNTVTTVNTIIPNPDNYTEEFLSGGFAYIRATTIGKNGNIYYAQPGNIYVESQQTRTNIFNFAGHVLSFFPSSEYGFIDGTGTNALFNFGSFNLAIGIITDPSGNLYVADASNNAIRKISFPGGYKLNGGVVTTIAVGFNYPRGIAIDTSGNIFVADSGNNRICKIVINTGEVTTLAGSGSAAFADGTGTSASFSDPRGIAIDTSGNLFVADTINSRIRKIVISTGEVTTVAAQLNNPISVVVDTINGNLFVNGGTGVSLLKIIISTQNISTLEFTDDYNTPGTPVIANENTFMSINLDGDIIRINHIRSAILKYNIKTLKITVIAGRINVLASPALYQLPVTSTYFNTVKGVAVDNYGNIFFVDQWNIGGIVPEKYYQSIKLAGADNGMWGWADGTGNNALVNNPRGLTIDLSNNLIFADTGNHCIRKMSFPNGLITDGGVVETILGNRANAFVDGIGAVASFSSPTGVVCDENGNIFVADSTNNRIRKIMPPTPTSIKLSVVAGGNKLGFADGNDIARFNWPLGNLRDITKYFNNPWALTIDSYGIIYVADTDNQRIRRVNIRTGEISTLAGSGYQGYANGIGTEALFRNPYGVACDTNGNLFVADSDNHCIRKIVIRTGVVSTFAGMPNVYGFANGTGNVARFNQPRGMAVGEDGSIIIVADTLNNRIRIINISTGEVSTLAGSGTAGFADGIGASAQFNYPIGVVGDSSVNIFVSDTSNHRIRKIDIGSAEVTTIAGTGAAGFNDGTAVSSLFNTPRGISINSTGSLFVADSLNNRIRMLLKTTNLGVVTTTTLAGSGAVDSADGTGIVAKFNNPNGVAIDAAGNVYVADTSNGRIRLVSPSGVVITLAGSSAGFADNTGTAASFNYPYGIAVDATGSNVYVADTNNHRIRKITFPNGLILNGGEVSTFAGSGALGSADGTGTGATFNSPQNVVVDVAGNVYVADTGNNRIRLVSPSGVVTTLAGSSSGFANGTGTGASFNSPVGMALNAAGNLYVADSTNNRIRKIIFPGGLTLNGGEVSTFAGSGLVGADDGTGTAASFYYPRGVAVDAAGNVYVGDAGYHRIRLISPSGVVTTIAGSSGTVGNFADGIGMSAKFYSPSMVAVDGANNLYVADGGNNRIRKIIVGILTINTLAGSGTATFADGIGAGSAFNKPNNVAVDAVGNLYVADTVNHRIRKVTSNGVVTTLAGSGTAAFADGSGTAASFNQPSGVAVDAAGNVYVADRINNRIRLVSPSGVVITLAGSSAGFADNTGTAALFNQPSGVAVDAAGSNVYVADMINNRIRKITFPNGLILNKGEVSTLAGSDQADFADGTGSAARFSNPRGVAVDAAGNLYVADSVNNLIRLVSPSGVVTTLAGSGTTDFADGTGTAARFYAPRGVALDAAGNVYVADTGNYRIRKITFPNGLILNGGFVTTIAGTTNGFLNGDPMTAKFSYPEGVAINAGGIIYIADTENNRIRKIFTMPAEEYTVSTVLNQYTDDNFGYDRPLGVTVDSADIVYTTTASSIYKIVIPPSVAINDYSVITLAGNGSTGTGDAIGTSATMHNPYSIVLDKNGVIYFTQNGNVNDYDNARIRKILPDKSVITILTTNPSTNGQYVPYTSLRSPRCLSIDSSGSLYVASFFYNVLQKITEPTITVNYLQMNTIYRYAEYAEGVAVDYNGVVYVTNNNGSYHVRLTPPILGLSSPTGIAVDKDNNILVADTSNNRVCIIYPDGNISKIGQESLSDNILNIQKSIFVPAGILNVNNDVIYYGTSIAVDSTGIIYVADINNHVIRKILPNGTVSILAGAVGVSGNVNGTNENARFNLPNCVAVSPDNTTVYVADSNNVIRTIISGNTQLFSLTNGFSFNRIIGIVVNKNNDVYIGEKGSRIRIFRSGKPVITYEGGIFATYMEGFAVDNLGNITVCRNESVGNGYIWHFYPPDITIGGYSSDGGYPMNGPISLHCDTLGNIWCGSRYTDTLLQIVNRVMVYAIKLYNGYGNNKIASDISGNLYVLSNDNIIRKIQFTRDIEKLKSPYGVAVNSSNKIYVADTGNNRIVNLLDNGAWNRLLPTYTFNAPKGIAIDLSNNIILSDTANNRIYSITPSSVVTLLGGNGSPGYLDGLSSISLFNNPTGVAVDSSGIIYVSDTGNSVIRYITFVYPISFTMQVSQTTTGAGTNSVIYYITPNNLVSFANPTGILLDISGNMYISDSTNNTIRLILKKKRNPS